MDRWCCHPEAQETEWWVQYVTDCSTRRAGGGGAMKIAATFDHIGEYSKQTQIQFNRQQKQRKVNQSKPREQSKWNNNSQQYTKTSWMVDYLASFAQYNYLFIYLFSSDYFAWLSPFSHYPFPLLCCTACASPQQHPWVATPLIPPCLIFSSVILL